MKKFYTSLLLLFLAPAYAQPPIILKAEAHAKANQLFDVAVTVMHTDTGWEHYAKEWVIVADGDKQLAKRTLHHPYVKEQPFTRYSRDVLIPADARRITIHATCNHGDESSAYILLSRRPKQEDKAGN